MKAMLSEYFSDGNAVLEDRLNDVQSTFLSTISHELLSPLTTVQGYISFMKGGHTGRINDQQYKMLNVAEKQISHLSYIVKELLELNWLQSEEIFLEKEPFDIISVIKTCFDSFKQQIRSKNLLFSSNIDEFTKISINGDSEKFSMIILNIIDNAVKFTPSGGSVEVKMDDLSTRVDIEIKDSGIGIEKKCMDNVCDPFYQIDNQSSRRYDGLGIGLTLAKGLVKLHEGSIKFDPVSPQGVCVKLSFPKTK